jgi:hypothetical protein
MLEGVAEQAGSSVFSPNCRCCTSVFSPTIVDVAALPLKIQFSTMGTCCWRKAFLDRASCRGQLDEWEFRHNQCALGKVDRLCCILTR